MGDLLGIVFVREIIRTLGQYTRYLFFMLIGRKKTIKELSSEVKKDDSNLGFSIQQDFYNAFIGVVVLVVISLIIMSIVY
jgi:hypothetical protein